MKTMLDSLMLLHFLSLLLLCCVSSSSSFFTENKHVACRSDQIQALTQFKNEFDSRSCNQSVPFNGVWCDNSTGAVTKLQLHACLSGTLKPNSSLFKLHHLRYLNLSNNFISSALPSQFGSLNRLEVLSLSSNGFLGQVPSSFSNLSLLEILDLSQNELTGSFSHVQNLTKLSRLDLSYNHFSGIFSPLCELHHLNYLILDYNNFSSSLPYIIGNLHKLEYLSLTSNRFFDQVPPTISNLTLLTKLFIDQNELTGSLPLVQNLTKFSALALSYNHFTGTISSLITMPLLFFLDVRGNSLVGSIEVPNSSISSRLEYMYLGHNHFEREILEPISNLINLTHLDLSYLNISHPIDLNLFSGFKSLLFFEISGNNISPTSFSLESYMPLNLEELFLSNCGITEVPNILKTLQNLQFISLSHNGIKGKVPKWLWSLPRLNSVDIAANDFNGFEGSAEILVNSSVQLLFMQFNNFEGALPNLPLTIKVLAAGGNSFTGKIPLSICNNSLDHLDLSYNKLTGPIPQCFGNLKIVNLRKNNFEGSIPDAFSAGAPLWTLDIGFNQITGKLPRSLLNCSSLRVLTIDHNRVKDTFPFWLKALPNLQVLILRSNTFYGPISPPHQSPFGFPELRIFEISDNNFSGSLPPRYFVNWKASSLTMNENGDLYMMHQEDPHGLHVRYSYTDSIDLQYKGLSMEQEKVLISYAAIDFSGNRIEGQIPESIGLLKGLIALNLSNNLFKGHIPMSLENLTELESLDLSRNQLSGNIPNGLKTLSFLAFINVSHNQLMGEIPQGTQITGQPKSSFEGNAWLCGLPLEESCSGTITPPIQQPKQEDDDEKEMLNRKAVAIGYGLGVLFGMAIAQVIVSYKLEWLTKIIGLTKRQNR